MNKIKKPEYFESQLRFENGEVYSKGYLYGSEAQFWDDVELGRIIYHEDIQDGLVQNHPENEEMTRATE